MATTHRSNQLESFVSAVSGRTTATMVADLPEESARRLAMRLNDDQRVVARQIQSVAAALVHAVNEIDAGSVEDIGWLIQSLAERVEFAADLQVMIDNRFTA